jgi:glutamate/tyrosine decarboxylase-like PLP-dependent enzyme
MGGFLLPFFRRLGADVPEFDLQVPGVTSISMDLHKYGFAPKGASVVLYRDAALRRHQIFCCASWPGYTVVNPTIQSARSGGPAAAAWSVLRYLGDAGYMGLAEELLASFRQLVAGLREIDGLRVLGTPHMTLAAVASDKVDLFHVIDDLRERGWYVQPQLSFGVTPATMHLQVAPANVGHVEQLLADLREVVAAAPAPQSAAGMADALADAMSGEGLDPALFDNMMSMVGVEAGALPTRMADVNRVLDALPPEARERLVVEFVNTLYG